MDIVIIGTGNVAHVLARVVQEAGHNLVEVAGRNPAKVKTMGETFGVSDSPSIAGVTRNADLYLVAVTDDALTTIGEWLKLDRKLVVHTAGSVSKEVLQPVSRNYGVLYPLQSLKAQMKILPEIPFLVDGNTPDDLTLIRDFALSLSDKVEVAGDEARLKLHLAAVVVNNFSNHLFALAEKFCIEENLPFDLLQPLIAETAQRLKYFSARDAQTGPAIRNDMSTIEKQKEMLQTHPALKELYDVMSSSIERFYK